MRCHRCNGPMFQDESSQYLVEFMCINCGARIYKAQSGPSAKYPPNRPEPVERVADPR